MSELWITLCEYLSYPFIQYALIVGVLIALSSSLLGVILVLKRFSFIGDGLSHVAFGAMAVASVVGLTNNMLIVLPVTVISAVILLKSGQNRKIKGDAAVAMISVGALAFGYLIMNMFSASSNVAGDVCSTLFGSVAILTLTKLDVWVCIAMSGIVIIFFLFFKNRIFAVAFDENFARTTGMRVELFNLVVAVLTAMIIVLAMKLVGSLLISALIIFPALSSMRMFKTFKSVIISSAVISLICAVFGILAAVLISTPVGSTVVVANIAVFFISFALGEVFAKKA